MANAGFEKAVEQEERAKEPSGGIYSFPDSFTQGKSYKRTERREKGTLYYKVCRQI